MKYLPKLLTGIAALILAACAGPEDLTERAPMGEFLLGHNIVVEEDAEVGPLSRRAEPDEWKAALTKAMDARLAGYEGSQYYHTAIRVEGYILAVPGVPIVANPKSVLVITATVWDDAAGGKINEEPEQFTVFESLSPETIFSSGLTKTREQQIEELSRNAARLVHEWMLSNQDWFVAKEGAPLADGAAPDAIAEDVLPTTEG